MLWYSRKLNVLCTLCHLSFPAVLWYYPYFTEEETKGLVTCWRGRAGIWITGLQTTLCALLFESLSHLRSHRPGHSQRNNPSEDDLKGWNFSLQCRHWKQPATAYISKLHFNIKRENWDSRGKCGNRAQRCLWMQVHKYFFSVHQWSSSMLEDDWSDCHLEKSWWDRGDEQSMSHSDYLRNV